MKVFLLIALGLGITIAEDSPVLKELTDGNLKFTANVYTELKKEEQGNFLVCPLSVDVVLALTQVGARGRTAQQLISALHLPDNKDKINEAFKAVAPSLNVKDKYTLNSANKIYVKDGYEINDEFKSVATDVFGAEVENVDFQKKEQAVDTMNKWVEDKTQNKIKNLLKPDDINKDTRTVLINAIYFHGNWIQKFHERATSKKPFHLDAKNVVQVDMMEKTSGYNYYEDAELDAKFLELPYEGNDISMTFVLPNKKDGLAALEANIAKVLVTPNYSNEEVHVQIPKFKSETTIQFVPILKKLGVIDAFENHANFSGILKSGEDLKISKVIQKAFIEVDEKGTTAAAATAVIQTVPLSGFVYLTETKEFIADHPFIYLLKYPNGILFVGRYVNK